MSRGSIAKFTVKDLILRRYPGLGAFADKKDVAQLLDPVESSVGTKVEHWYEVGYRKSITSVMRDAFTKYGITDEQIADDLNCSISTVNRFWNGKSAFRKLELLEGRYSVVCGSYQQPSRNERIIDGCCEAMRNVSQHYAKVLERYGIALITATPPPPIDQTNFAFLSSLIHEDKWSLGKKSKSAELLAKAADAIHSAVRNSDLGDPHKLKAVSHKSSGELDAIYQTWFPWYVIVVDTIVRPGFQLYQGNEWGEHS